MSLIRTGLTAAAGLGLSCALLAGAAPAPAATVDAPVAVATPAAATPADSNPLANRTWGVYEGLADQAWQPYVDATGEDKELLAKIALRPKAQWFGRWISDASIESKVRAYVEATNGGDPETLVQMAIFRMDPWEGDACKKLPTAAQQASYKSYVDSVAAGIGEAHVALIQQPDGPFALCAPKGSKLPSKLIGYATKRFSALPNTSVYIDAGASDWLRNDPKEALHILLPAGVSHARGFALNSTHYASTKNEVAFGAKVVKALAARGIPNMHFVVNTAQNGRPFDGFTYKGPNFDNAKVCKSLSDRRCVTLGIPPTTDVANPAWGLKGGTAAKAAAYVDGFLWFGRPWLYEQADPFDLKRALQLARTTPYA